MWAASHNVDGGKKVRKRPPPIGMVSVRPGSKEPPVPQQQTQVQLLEEKSGAPEDEAAPPAPAVGPVVGSSIAEWLDGIKPGFSRFAEAFSSSGYEDAAMLFVVRLPYRNTRTQPPRVHARTDAAQHPHVHAFPECRFSLFFPPISARLIRCRICCCINRRYDAVLHKSSYARARSLPRRRDGQPIRCCPAENSLRSW